MNEFYNKNQCPLCNEITDKKLCSKCKDQVTHEYQEMKKDVYEDMFKKFLIDLPWAIKGRDWFKKNRIFLRRIK